MLRFDPPHSSTTSSFYTPTKERLGDLTAHFDVALSPDEQKMVEQSLICRQGIEKVTLQPHHPNLAIIYYDVFLTSSKTIFKILNGDCLLPFQKNDGESPRVRAQIIGI